MVLRLIDLLFLMRPVVLVPVWTMLLVGYITLQPLPLLTLAVDASMSWLLIFYSLGVASIYVFNQIVDMEGDRINNKLFFLPQEVISTPVALSFAVVLLITSLAGCYVFVSPSVCFVMVVAHVLGVGYNFPPLNLRNHPVGGVVANSLGHGVLTYLIVWVALFFDGGSIALGVAYSLFAGFANGAVYLMSTIPDIEGDSRVGKNTFAVIYGKKATVLLASCMVVLSALLSVILPYNRWVFLGPALCSTLLYGGSLVRKGGGSARSIHLSFVLPVLLLGLSVALYVPWYGGVVVVVLGATRVYYSLRFKYAYPSV